MSRPICLWSLLFLTCVSFFQFSLRKILVVATVTLLFVDNIGGLRPLQYSAWGGGAPQSCFSYFCNPHADLRLYISALLQFGA